jgi:16S rRNA (cytidine1402-2'-O)-methyltransferase
MKKTGILYLIPTTISQDSLKNVLPKYTLEKIKGLTTFICENEKTARNHLKEIVAKPVREIRFLEINKHKVINPKSIATFLDILTTGENVGLISESGCPSVADPGSEIVMACHRENIRVVPLIGPSSFLMSLMASGLNGQHFKFVGYLSKEPNRRKKDIKNLEQESKKRNTAMIIMETPYRTQHLWKDLILNCKPDTFITIALELSSQDEFIKTAKASQWQNMKWPDLDKKKAVFLIQA